MAGERARGLESEYRIQRIKLITWPALKEKFIYFFERRKRTSWCVYKHLGFGQRSVITLRVGWNIVIAY